MLALSQAAVQQLLVRARRKAQSLEHLRRVVHRFKVNKLLFNTEFLPLKHGQLFLKIFLEPQALSGRRLIAQFQRLLNIAESIRDFLLVFSYPMVDFR